MDVQLLRTALKYSAVYSVGETFGFWRAVEHFMNESIGSDARVEMIPAISLVEVVVVDPEEFVIGILRLVAVLPVVVGPPMQLGYCVAFFNTVEDEVAGFDIG